ncbi:D-glycero-alpha-D-manno-heptose-1,7-bisphosphate 7-phosphatase [Streptomyces sp. NPDC092296]|uniref:D-glycero-alpha-D-manno-heptose-1,7-bisphosphate 7-phosphatase n=1 Tax=Streptomyces sp. NPDC092296 TaxID=3366012 RepID=UPI0038225D74
MPMPPAATAARPVPAAPAPAAQPWIFPHAAPAERRPPPGPDRPRRPGRPGPAGRGLPDAVLFDRDGTLVFDVPYNGDPGWVRPVPQARAALAQLRTLGVPVGVVSNQSGVARGVLTRRQVTAVQERVEQLLGPFRVWAVCPHGPDDHCGCRKPAPGLILAACGRIGADPARTVVIGDIGADVAAAAAAGARGILVPAPATRPEEVDRAGEVAPDLLAAVRLALHLPPAPTPGSAP